MRGEEEEEDSSEDEEPLLVLAVDAASLLPTHTRHVSPTISTGIPSSTRSSADSLRKDKSIFRLKM